MTVFRRAVFFAVLTVVIPTAASAQRRVPATGSAAVGGDVGVYLPRDEQLDAGLAVDGFYEYYLSPRVSMRIGVGLAEPDFSGRADDSLRIIRVPFELLHNWEGGAVHPFVGAGLGVYFVQGKQNGHSVGDNETKIGGSLLGGAEFFTGRSTAVKVEGRYHILDGVRGIEPDGLSLSVGVKKYF